MPRYFFDIDDGEHLVHDDEGQAMFDLQAAREEAICVLPAIALDVLPSGNHREFKTVVRTESGQRVFIATLTLQASYVA